MPPTMDEAMVRELLAQVAAGQLSERDALGRLLQMPAAELGYATVDHHRLQRLGVPEVIYGSGKTSEQIIGIARELMRRDQDVLVTRLEPEKAAAVQRELPEFSYRELARVGVLRKAERPLRELSPVAVVTAGTSDLPVAEEAIETLLALGIAAERVYDVGVAGLHRLLGKLPVLEVAPAVIVIAGMEGALPSVVGGLVRGPIVAVPTSVGYGAALGGFTALFGMLTGCASGVSVVNIDNGFGAAMAVARIVGAPVKGPKAS